MTSEFTVRMLETPRIIIFKCKRERERDRDRDRDRETERERERESSSAFGSKFSHTRLKLSVSQDVHLYGAQDVHLYGDVRVTVRYNRRTNHPLRVIDAREYENLHMEFITF